MTGLESWFHSLSNGTNNCLLRGGCEDDMKSLTVKCLAPSVSSY